MQDRQLVQLAEANFKGLEVAADFLRMSAPVRYTFPPEVFGQIVAEVLKDYTPEQRQAFRVGFLAAMGAHVGPAYLPAPEVTQ